MKNFTIKKRDGRLTQYDPSKIIQSINAAHINTQPQEDIDEIKVLQKVESLLNQSKAKEFSVETINDFIERALQEYGYNNTYISFHSYRKERTLSRFKSSPLIQMVHALGISTDRDNANVGNNFAAKTLRIASETNKECMLSVELPKSLAKLHDLGDLYFHDLDSFNLTVNCLHIDTGKHLAEGFNTGYGRIQKPNRIETAAGLSCILLQSSQNDLFGGQSHVDFDNDMAPYVQATRVEVIKDLFDTFLASARKTSAEAYKQLSQLTGEEYYDQDEDFRDLIEERVVAHTHQAMQGVVYNLNTMHSRAGSQVPFSSLNIGLPRSKDAALVCQAFLEEYIKGLGGAQPIFPNIIFRIKKGVNAKPGDPYYYLKELAMKSTAARMNPTYMNLDADFNLQYYNKGIVPATMGCRTYICSNINGPEGPSRRGNNFPTTINLPRLGIQAHGNVKYFFQLLDNMLEKAKESLIFRYNVTKRLKGRDLPFIVSQHLMLGSEEVGPNDSIEPILRNGSIAIGFIGLAETLVALTGHHHGETKEARELGYQIIQHIRDFTDKTTLETHLNWGCYATPAEGLSGKFIVKDKARFGIIPGVTDKEYYTNSFHVPVGFPISIIDKINIEAPFHKMCNSGHISYIELDGYPDAKTIERIIDYAYDKTNISYMGINFHMRYCKKCGQTVNEQSLTCPECGSHDIQGVSRVTGYLSLDERFGQSKAAERRDRLSNASTTLGNKVYTSIEQ